MKRREFLEIVVASAAAGVPACGETTGAKTIQKAGWRLELDSNQNIVSLRRGSVELIPAGMKENRPRVLGNASLGYDIDLLDLGGAVAVKQTLSVTGRTGAKEAVTVIVPRAIKLPSSRRSVFLPLSSGVGWRGPAGEIESAYVLTGGPGFEAKQTLALPLVNESSPEGPLSVCCLTDTFFAAGFRDSACQWAYTDKVPLPEGEKRSVYTVLHEKDPDFAIRRFYDLVLPDVRPGPDWLHSVALVNYDYLSDNGRGWFADIDSLASAIPKADRGKVLLVLHGWYGYFGRYAYDHRSRTLYKAWVAMPESRAPEVQKIADQYNPKNPYSWKPEAIRALKPVPMSIQEMHRRIQYAKDRGFRVLIYFGDGLASSEGLTETFHPSKVLRWGGWVLPDTLGKPYVMNPLHPEVQSFFLGYCQALLAEYGKEIDGFAWDETFYVTSKDLGNAEYPGYAARAMMRLVQKLSVMTQNCGPDLAFMTSDNLGLSGYDGAYALAAHGNFQDSAMFPPSWNTGLFSNYRNVHWSCNWGPIGLIDRTRYAVEYFSAPVSISNGYGEDLGVAEMTREQRGKVLELFELRKNKRMDITWLEEKDGKLSYKGRELPPPPEL